MAAILVCFLLLLSLAGAQSTSGNGCPKGSFQSGLQCLQCPIGTYSDEEGATECTKCPPGFDTFAKASTSMNQCFSCRFGDFEDNGVCKQCPRNTYANKLDEATECLPCPPGTVSGKRSPRLSSCVTCRAGLLVDPESFSACSTCPAGKTTSSVNSMTCEDCPAGTTTILDFSSPQRGLCGKCAPGTFAPTKGSPTCEPCPVGSYQTASGASSCDKCPDGSTTAGKGRLSCRPTCLPSEPGCIWCPPGQGYNTENKMCERCPDGFVSKTATSTECLRCPDGEGKANEKRTKCVCEVGFRLKKDGTCERCPSRFTSDGAKCFCPLTGLGVNKGRCECPDGEKYDYSKRICVPADDPSLCPNGIIVQNGDCKACPGDSVPDGSRTICTCGVGRGLRNGNCVQCKAGEFARRNNMFNQASIITCAKCFRGRFSDKPGAETCQFCPDGLGPSKEGATACLQPCPAGAERDPSIFRSTDECVCKVGYSSSGKDLNLTCTKCGENESSDPPSGQCRCADGFEKNESTGECEVCQKGTFGKGGTCEPCPSGMVAQKTGQTKCKKCKKSFEAFGASRCLPRCIKGFFRNADRVCETCAAGQVVVDMKCVPCPANSVSEGKDATACTECTGGKSPNANGDECV